MLKFYFLTTNSLQTGHCIASIRVTSGSKLIFDIESKNAMLDRCNSAVLQLIKRNYLSLYKISFTEKVQYEDDDFAYRLYAYANRTRLVSMAPYIVRVRVNSTTRRKNDFVKLKDIYLQSERVRNIAPALVK